MGNALGIDVGGSKTLLALVEGDQVIEELTLPTARAEGAGRWCDDIAGAARRWEGRFAVAGAAVTGTISGGRWSALNPATLPVPADFPLEAELSARLGCPVRAWNDAQAAAWGEHRFGAGNGGDLVFVTVSTGIGGGAVVGGKLLVGLSGIAASVGQVRLGLTAGTKRIEDEASGQWIASAAHAAGQATDARGVFVAAAGGADWARAIVATSAERVAVLLVSRRLLFDPPVIVLGGGVGLAPGYADAVRAELRQSYPVRLRPDLRLAALGPRAGVLGAADLAIT